MRAEAGRFFLWVAAAVSIGLACGAGSIALSALVDGAYRLFASFPLFAAMLPFLGVAAVCLYRAARVPFDFGTIDVVASMRAGRAVPFAVAPLIAVASALTTLGGGSIGKEAAALQLGGAAASRIADVHEELARDRGVILAAGMAAAFSALLFAPLAATVFVLELSKVSRARLFRARTLCIPASAAVAYALADVADVGRIWAAGPLGAFSFPERLVSAAVVAPSFPTALPECAVVGTLSALLGLAFCAVLKLGHTASVTFLKRPWLRMVVGGACCVALMGAMGTTGGHALSLAAGESPFGTLASGTGGAEISAALSGQSLPQVLLWAKLALTLLCLGFGFKGGEIMPVLCMGACLGNLVGFATGADPAFVSAVGMAALFAACTGCPAASVILGCEAVGWAAAPWLLVAVAFASVGSRALNLYDTHTWMIDVPWARGKGYSGRGQSDRSSSQRSDGSEEKERSWNK